MEMDLNSVIEKIKQEGVEQAEKRAQDIVRNAEIEAEKITGSAEKEKEKILKNAAEEADRLKSNGENALRQAARDVIIALKTRVIELLDSVIKKEVSGALSPDVLKDIIVKLVAQSLDKETFDLEVLLNEKDKKDLRGLLESALKKELMKGITLKASSSIEKGFRIGEKDKNLYYDCTDEAIAETFNFYLNKKVKEIIELGMRHDR